MISQMIAFIVMLNPFALFIYLEPIMAELNSKDFIKVLLKASLISYIIFIVFMIAGDFLFNSIFQISIESFRIFGGIIIFSFAYLYIVKGEKALIHMKEDLDDLASEIALPFMVGAGTISLAILMGNELSYTSSMTAIAIVMIFTILAILILKSIKEHIARKKFRIAFDKNMQILLRLNGFFVGAIGVNMIILALSRIIPNIL